MNEARLRHFVGEDWSPFLLPFFKSDEWKYIQRQIKQEKDAGLEICPREEELFRCFKECPLHKLHTILLVDECYNVKVEPTFGGSPYYFADGLALSARRNFNCPGPLNYVFTALDDRPNMQNKNIISDTDDYDLKRWANQGILLLNCSLTAVIGQEYSHVEIWKPFIIWILEYLNYHKDGLGVILMGKYAKQFNGIFDNSTFGIFSCEHPMEAVRKQRLWRDEDVFIDLTNFHYHKNNITINWE